MSVDKGSMREHGSLRITWRSPALPWVRYHVLVDDAEVGVVQYRRPSTWKIVAGWHNVTVHGPRHRYQSSPLSVEIVPDREVGLFAGNRLPPGGLNTRELMTWGKVESGIWLSAAPTAPPAERRRPVKRSTLAFDLFSVVFFATMAIAGLIRGRWLPVVVGLVFVAGGIAKVKGDLARRHRSGSEQLDGTQPAPR